MLGGALRHADGGVDALRPHHAVIPRLAWLRRVRARSCTSCVHLSAPQPGMRKAGLSSVAWSALGRRETGQGSVDLWGWDPAGWRRAGPATGEHVQLGRVAGLARRCAARETPCAWLPADEQMTPRARCSASSCAMRLYAPRSLKENTACGCLMVSCGAPASSSPAVRPATSAASCECSRLELPWQAPASPSRFSSRVLPRRWDSRCALSRGVTTCTAAHSSGLPTRRGMIGPQAGAHAPQRHTRWPSVILAR